VQPLITCLHDSIDYVQVAAASALGDIGDIQAVPALFEMFMGKTYALTKGEGSPGQYGGLIEAAAVALGKIGTAEAVQGLLEALDNKGLDNQIRAAAALGLGYSHHADAFPALAVALHHNYHYIRLLVCRGLGYLGDEQAVELLLDMLHDPVWVVQVAAIEALGQMRALDAGGTLLRVYLNINHFMPRDKAPTGIPHHDIQMRMRVHAAYALGRIGWPPALVQFETDLNANDPETRTLAAIGLVLHGDDLAFNILDDLLQTPYVYSITETALMALADTGTMRALAIIQTFVDRQKGYIPSAAICGLEQFGVLVLRRER
jgi:HEAT repeat protein